MKAKTHSILTVVWVVIALISLVRYVITGDSDHLIFTAIFTLFSAEHNVIAEIKELKEDK